MVECTPKPLDLKSLSLPEPYKTCPARFLTVISVWKPLIGKLLGGCWDLVTRVINKVAIVMTKN